MANRMQHPFDPDTTRLIKNKSYRLSRRSGFTRSDRDDIEQELTLHLWMQKPKYKSSLGPWLTWASFILDNKCISMQRHRHAAQRNPKREECSLNEPVLDADRRAVDRHQTTPEAARDFRAAIDFRIDLNGIQALLSDDAWLYLRRLVEGSGEAASDGHLPTRSVAARCRREIRLAFEIKNLHDRH